MDRYVPRPLRVFIVDDHEVVRRGLEDLLGNKRDISVVGGSGSAPEAVRMITRSRPDVMMLDLHMRDGSGLTVCRQVRRSDPSIKGLLLTAAEDDEALASAVVAGAHGYVLKEARTAELVDALRRLGSGESLLDEPSARRIVDWLGACRTNSKLSDRERRTVEYVLSGLEGKKPGDPVDVSDERLEAEVADLVRNLVWTSAHR
jgi:two-component system, NarL family, response regulator DevR